MKTQPSGLMDLTVDLSLMVLMAGGLVWSRWREHRMTARPVWVEVRRFSFTNWRSSHPIRSNALLIDARDTVFYVYMFQDFAVLEFRHRPDMLSARGLLFAVKTSLGGNTQRLDCPAPIPPKMAYTYTEEY